MGKHYTKADVQTHAEGYYGPQHPAVNVKRYRYDWDSEKIRDEFCCTEQVATETADIAFECACMSFWENLAPMAANECFDNPVKIYQEGRSGGWLIVDGLDPIESWDAVMLAQWRSFEKRIRAEVDYLLSWEQIKESISANGWAEPCIDSAV